MPTASGSHRRVSELILTSYFAYTLLLALLLPVSGEKRLLAGAASLAAIAVFAGIARVRPSRSRTALRCVLPIAGVLLAYQQMGWFAQEKAGQALEDAWVRWDRVLLGDWGLTALIDCCGPLVPAVLELLYLLTYVVGPLGLLAVSATGRIGRADRYLAIFVASAVASYALYPYFPSEPPRTVFPGELFSQHETVFRRINWWVLGGGGIHTSVFPSGHVSSSFGAGFGLLYAIPERKRFGIGMIALACGIALATVYGRYHYAVDALAGLGASLAATAACVCWFRMRRSG